MHTFPVKHISMPMGSRRLHQCHQGDNKGYEAEDTKIYKIGEAEPTNEGHSGNCDSESQWGSSTKKGCKEKFMVKVLNLHDHVAVLCFIQEKHCNAASFRAMGTQSWVKDQFSMHTRPSL